MALAYTNRKQVPAEGQLGLDAVEYFGLPWKYVPEYHVIADTKNNRLQVRDIAKVAPQNEVAGYADAYRRGEKLPPILVTKDGFIVDGATRNEAARKARLQTLPAIVIMVDFGDAPPLVCKNILKLGTRMNKVHGRGMERANISALIDRFADEGESPEALARDLNCSAALVRGVMAARKARTRLTEHNVSTEGLTHSHLSAMGGIAYGFNDPVYIQLADLIRNSGMSSDEARGVVRKLGYVTNDEDKLKILAEEEDSRDMQAERPSRAGKLRQTMGRLLPFGDAPYAAVEVRPDLAARQRTMLIQVRNVIDKILAEQDSVIASLGTER